MKEKKEIKISLWTFYVLVAGIVMMISGIIIASFHIIGAQNDDINKPNTNQLGTNIGNNQNVNESQNRVLTKDGLWDEENQKYQYPELSKYPNMDNLLQAFGLYYANSGDMTLSNTSTNTITNDQIFKIARNIAEEKEWDENTETKFAQISEPMDVGYSFYTANSIEKAIKTVFGNNVNYNHKNWSNNTPDYDGIDSAIYLDGEYGVNRFYLGGPYPFELMGQYIERVELINNNIEITVKMANYKWQDFNINQEYYIYDNKDNITAISEVYDSPEGDSFFKDLVINFMKENPNKVPTYKYTFKLDETNGNYYFNEFKLIKEANCMALNNIVDNLLLPNKEELDINKLNSIIDTTKKVEDVNNYASTMKWETYTMDDLSFQYPKGWKIEKGNNEIEEIRISGTAVGKSVSKTEVGENGNEVVAKDMIIVVYKPIECTKAEKENMFINEFTSAYDSTGSKGGLYWTIDTKRGDYLYAYDNYAFYENGADGYKLARVRFLYPISENETFKTTNIENHFFAEIKLRK